ncbi:hypothetical protein BGZ60DRAFT_544271 [Tricladium varicosporioides]|nr:hypothetical protein BGZ60DRAFT_544271 [Hymenoscyphus varicosporioides]
MTSSRIEPEFEGGSAEYAQHTSPEQPLQQVCHIITPVGMLGYGFDERQIEQALEDLKSSNAPIALILDSGSTDSGPAKLALGTFTAPRSSYERDFRKLLALTNKYKTSLLISSAGGDGTDAHVDAFLDIIQEICNEEGNSSYQFETLAIYSNVSKPRVLASLKTGEVRGCGTSVPTLTEKDVNDAVTIVAQMGPEPFVDAMEAAKSFDIVIGGRSYDPSPYAAFAIYNANKLKAPTKSLTHQQVGGFTHMGKIMECGALCATPKSQSAMATIYLDGTFDIKPLGPGTRCTPTSVAAHTLYEKTRPDMLPGPGGNMDLSNTSYLQLDDQCTVRVKGATFEFSRAVALPYTVKLEAAKLSGYRAMFMGGIRDPILIKYFAEFKGRIREFVASQNPNISSPHFWKLGFHVYGDNGVMESLEPGDRCYQPREIFIVGEVLASTQQLASSIASTARIACVHGSYPGQRGTGGNFAMGVGGVMEIPLGPSAEFCIYHLIPLEKGEETARRIGDEFDDAISKDTVSPIFKWKATTIKSSTTANGTILSSVTVNSFVKHSPALVVPPPLKRQNPTQASTLNFTTPQTLADIAPVIRSKNSGPYEITLDVVFSSRSIYNLVKTLTPTLLGPTTISKLYNIPEEAIIWCGFFDQALAWKCTIPRRRVEILDGVGGEGECVNKCSGGFMESDVHASQQYAGLLNLELGDEVVSRIREVVGRAFEEGGA